MKRIPLLILFVTAIGCSSKHGVDENSFLTFIYTVKNLQTYSRNGSEIGFNDSIAWLNDTEFYHQYFATQPIDSIFFHKYIELNISKGYFGRQLVCCPPHFGKVQSGKEGDSKNWKYYYYGIVKLDRTDFRQIIIEEDLEDLVYSTSIHKKLFLLTFKYDSLISILDVAFHTSLKGINPDFKSVLYLDSVIKYEIERPTFIDMRDDANKRYRMTTDSITKHYLFDKGRYHLQRKDSVSISVWRTMAN